MYDFRVGDYVCKCSIYHVPKTCCRVRRILKRYVELSDNTLWSYDGLPYPRRLWPEEYIRPSGR